MLLKKNPWKTLKCFMLGGNTIERMSYIICNFHGKHKILKTIEIT